MTDYLQAAGKEPEPEPPKPGIVTIIVDPPETNISVGYKQYKANAVGHASIELPVGQHKIDFRLKGYEPVTRNVKLSANENKMLVVTMYLSKVEEAKRKIAQELGLDYEKAEDLEKGLKGESTLIENLTGCCCWYVIYLIVLGLLPPV